MNKQEDNYKKIKENQYKKDTKKFKEKYFEFYDDVKSSTHKHYDW